MKNNKDPWNMWVPVALRELDAFGNSEEQARSWKEHLDKDMYCFYDCLLEDSDLLSAITEYPDSYDGVDLFIKDLKKLTVLIDAFDDLLIDTFPLDNKQDYRDLMPHVLNHTKWHEIQKLAWNLHERLQKADKECKK